MSYHRHSGYCSIIDDEKLERLIEVRPLKDSDMDLKDFPESSRAPLSEPSFVIEAVRDVSLSQISFHSHDPIPLRQTIPQGKRLTSEKHLI
ncbi:hypothetical protein J6590_103342 [Homalodisca vitripennis]|nr:hypothetical protein J6590_103342 [Homalodisca vitripennis]